MTPGEKLFKDVLTDEDEDFLYEDSNKQSKGKQFKALTLCMICNPTACGHDQAFNTWKQSARAEKAKKIVINSSSYQTAMVSGAKQHDEN